MMGGYLRNRKANSIIEYSLIIGIVALALSMMNIYIKRGVQGRVKDMADFFIGGGKQMQDSTTNARAISDSRTENTSRSLLTSRDILGGAREIGISDDLDIQAETRVEDIKKIIVPDASVSTAGYGLSPVPEMVSEETVKAAESAQSTDLIVREDIMRRNSTSGY